MAELSFGENIAEAMAVQTRVTITTDLPSHPIEWMARKVRTSSLPPKWSSQKKYEVQDLRKRVPRLEQLIYGANSLEWDCRVL